MSEKKPIPPGIPDDQFIRGKVPMTKEEIRVLTLAKLQAGPKERILEIGAGTGSITVECALLSSEGEVLAVEKNPEGIALIEENCKLFDVRNVRIIEGEAPRCLAGISEVDGVIIGGSGGNLAQIITACSEILRPGGRMVINAVLLDSVQEGLTTMKSEGFAGVSLISVSVARGRELGGKMALEGLNPVFIIWGTKQEQREVM